MQVNSNIYGDSTQWLYDGSISYNPTTSETTDRDLIFYCGKHRRIDTYPEFEINKPIDYSICYCAHAAAEKMPLADIAAVDYQGNVVATQTENNAWFMVTNNNVSTPQKDTLYLCNALALAANETTPTTRSNATRWYPKAAVEGYTGTNASAPMRPIVSFPLRGFYGAIQVEIAHKTNKNEYLTFWLKDLEDAINIYKDNYYINSAYLRLYAYMGGGKSNTSYSDFAQKNVIAWGAGFNKPMKIGTQNLDVLSYSWSSRGNYNLPIFGSLALDRRVGGSSYTKYFGTPVYPYDWSTYGDQRGNDCAAILYGYSWGEVKEVLTTQNDGGYTVYCLRFGMDITADNIEKIRKGAAAYGIFFTDYNPETLKTDATNNTRWYNEKMCLGVLDDDNIGHGEYTRGINNVRNKIWDYTNSTDSTYNPNANTDTNTYSITTGFNTVGSVASTTKAYVVNAAALTGLSGEMWNIINNLVTTPDDMTNLDNLTLDAFLTNNPIDAIVSVKKFPLSSVPHAESLENIYLGKYQTGAAGYALAMQQARYNFEGIPIFPKFGNCFLDYAPYTKMQLYVPFCGTIEIDAADFMGRTLSVEMVIDFITGAVTAYVLANQLVVTSLTGNCGIDIAVTGTEQSTVSAALENAILQDKSARGNYALKGSVGGMLTNPIGNLTHPTTAIENRFSTKLQTMQANYNLQHVEIPLRQIGQASPLNSWALEFVCRLIIYYPDGECITFNATNEPSLVTDKVESFGAVNGFATVETGTLNSFTGFTQVSDADLSGVSATDTEKEMILNLLQSGVYL